MNIRWERLETISSEYRRFRDVDIAIPDRAYITTDGQISKRTLNSFAQHAKKTKKTRSV